MSKNRPFAVLHTLLAALLLPAGLLAAGPAAGQGTLGGSGITYEAGPYSIGGALRDIDRQAAHAQGFALQYDDGPGLTRNPTGQAQSFNLGTQGELQLRGGTQLVPRPGRPVLGRDQAYGANSRPDDLDVGLYAETLFERWRLSANLQQGLGNIDQGAMAGMAELSYGFSPFEGVKVRMGPNLTWANRSYLSGLRANQGPLGVGLLNLGQSTAERSDVGFSVTATWNLFGNWTMDSTLGVARALNEPAAGAENIETTQGFGLLGIRYRF